MLTDPEMLQYLHPEVLLILFAVFAFIGGTWNSTRLGWAAVGTVAVGFASYLLSRHGLGPTTNVMSGVIRDELSYGCRRVALLLCVLFILFSTHSHVPRLYPELVGLLALIFVGLMLVASAGDLTLLFLGLEMISIPTYVMLFLGGEQTRGAEASAKYFYLSILASALMLTGFACLYGLAGETGLAAISASLHSPAPPLFPYLYPLALGLIFVGLGFKITAVPFHFYAPDVYQATTNLNAALLAVVPKIAGVIALVRLVVVAIPHDSAFAWRLLAAISIVTMSLGNVAALWQTNVRRMMAYSSIAHAGYLLIGVATAMGHESASLAGRASIAGTLLYVVVYSLASIGVFAALGYLSDDAEPRDSVESLAGIGRLHPLMGGTLALCLFSLAGIPPLAGFWGKLSLFRSALDAGLQADGIPRAWDLGLCVVGVLNAAIAAAYYLRLIAAIFFQSSSQSEDAVPMPGHTGAGLAALLSGGLVVAVGIWTGSALTQAQTAADGLWRSPSTGASIQQARHEEAPTLAARRERTTHAWPDK